MNTELVKPDFSEAKDSVTAGTYKVRVCGHKRGEWNNDRGTTPWINWELQTFGETEEKNNGRRIFFKTPISGGGIFKFENFYKAAMKTPFPRGSDFDPEMIHGKDLQVTVVETTDAEGNLTGFTDVKAMKAL